MGALNGKAALEQFVKVVVGFLAGPDSRWLTGQNLLATGGLLI